MCQNVNLFPVPIKKTFVNWESILSKSIVGLIGPTP